MEQRTALDPRITIGRHTYFPEGVFKLYHAGDRIEVGAFCSISDGVTILGSGEHHIDRPTTYPLQAKLFDPPLPDDVDGFAKGVTRIGNDVWIGHSALILSGVTIGDGAVIGAGAVVSKSVPPYAIAVGNPASVQRYRFDAQTRRRLLALRWWDWDDEQIDQLKELLVGDVAAFLEAAERSASPAAGRQRPGLAARLARRFPRAAAGGLRPRPGSWLRRR
jgi:acetyltransferase-like isoleucine patch superfamily enzyme